ISAVAILSGLIQHRDGRILNTTVLGFTVISLDPDMSRIDRAEMDARAHLERFAHGNVLSIFIPDLDIINPDLRPIFANTRFPLAEIAGRGAIAFRNVAVTLRRGRVKPLGVFFDYVIGIGA